ncbi:hypothetical protein [Nocardia sp. NPDC003979]
MGIIVESAQLPASSDEDRLVVTDHAVIVLDGATAHDPAMPSAGAYVDFLASDLAESIDTTSPSAVVLEQSIASAVAPARNRTGRGERHDDKTVVVVRIAG